MSRAGLAAAGLLAVSGVTGCGLLCDLGIINCKKTSKIDTECWSHAEGERVQCSGDDDEPNDTFPTADTADAPACAPAAPAVRRGTIAGNDVDVFRTRGTLCQSAEGPTLSVVSGDVRACLFAQCRSGSTGLKSCTADSIPMHLPSGLFGCCREGPGDVSGDFECTSNQPKVDVYLVVDGEGSDCAAYELQYRL